MAEKYTPKTEAGKEALANGADPTVVEEMENDGTFSSEGDSKEKKPGEHVDKPTHEEDDKGSQNGEGGDEGDDKGEGKGKSKSDAGAEGEEDDEGDGKPINRTPKFIPAWKHKEELKKAEDRIRAEMSGEIDTLNGKLTDLANKKGGATDDDIKAIADEFGLEPTVASAMIDKMTSIAEKRLNLPELRKGFEATQEAQKAKAEEDGFVKELESATTQEALKAVAGDHEITKAVVDKIKQLAYTTTYARYRLADIVRLEASSIFGDAAPTERKTAEAGRGGSGRGASQKGISEMSPEEIDSLSDEEFLTLSDEMAKGHGRFTKITKPVTKKAGR